MMLKNILAAVALSLPAISFAATYRFSDDAAHAARLIGSSSFSGTAAYHGGKTALLADLSAAGPARLAKSTGFLAVSTLKTGSLTSPANTRVPEPETYALIGMGLIAMIAARQRKVRRS